MWKKFDASAIKGVKVPGDRDVPATAWWNILWLKLFVWKTAMIFRVIETDAKRGYRLGYKAHDGTCRLLSMELHETGVAVRIGREDCVFFAVDRDGRELWLRPDCQTHVTRLAEHQVRLV